MQVLGCGHFHLEYIHHDLQDHGHHEEHLQREMDLEGVLAVQLPHLAETECVVLDRGGGPGPWKEGIGP